MCDERAIDDGGPAFPLPLGTGNESDMGQSGGMMLRDWFAGQAIKRWGGDDFDSFERLADECYQLADKMIARRRQ